LEMAPLIFTSEFLKNVRPEPLMSDPLSHQVARRSLYERHRDRLERWTAGYPEYGRDQLVGRLRAKKDEQHEAAVMELALHRVLSTHFGFDKVVPDQVVQGKTPDFRVVAGKKTSFIVELQTVTEDPEERKADRRRRVLADQINACAPPAMTVVLHFDSAADEGPADYVSEDAAPAKIARRLASELNSISPGTRRPFEEYGARFTWEVLPRPMETLVVCANGAVVGDPMMERARDALSKKASKYKKIVGPLPYVVALAGFGCDGLSRVAAEVLYGPLAMTWDARDRVAPTRLTRGVNRGYVTGKDSHSHLSAVLTICGNFDHSHGGFIYEIGVVHNPLARTPLPVEVFGDTFQVVPTEITPGGYEERVVGTISEMALD